MAVDEALNQGSYETSKVNQAWITIRGVQYTGNRVGFDFQAYRRVLDEAWRDLAEAGHDISDATKIFFLLEGIKSLH